VAMAAGAFHLSTILYSGQDGTQRERAWGGRGSDAGRGWACDQPSLRDENSTIILGRKPAPDPGVTRCALSRWAELRALNRSFKLEFASWNLQVGICKLALSAKDGQQSPLLLNASIHNQFRM
jgi:hypothetical protein